MNIYHIEYDSPGGFRLGAVVIASEPQQAWDTLGALAATDDPDLEITTIGTCAELAPRVVVSESL